MPELKEISYSSSEAGLPFWDAVSRDRTLRRLVSCQTSKISGTSDRDLASKTSQGVNLAQVVASIRTRPIGELNESGNTKMSRIGGPSAVDTTSDDDRFHDVCPVGMHETNSG
jgi:hypothetical protein